MDTLPIPSRPNLEQYRKRAKNLVALARRRDPVTLHEWTTDWLLTIAKLMGVEITEFVQNSFDRAVEQVEKRVAEANIKAGGKLSLADAQWIIAQAHGFENWANFAAHIEGPQDEKGRQFEAAADAVVHGDVETLRRMLREDPELIRARSPRVHKATLLHYVAANGVEDFRQKTPPNALEVATVLLDEGPEVDAVAETYGGGLGQTTLNLLVSSTHPHVAGLQSKLAELLLDYGAAINGLEDDGSPIMTALAFWYGETAATLAHRGARIDNLIVAAAVGRLDVVKQMVQDANTLTPTVRTYETVWYKLPRDPRAHIEMAAAMAAHYRRDDVLDFLLGIGVSPSAKDLDDMTLLHWAGATGDLALIERLVKRGASLESENKWSGTVLGSTTHFVTHGPITGADYPAVIDLLLRLGADVRWSDFPTGNAAVDAVLTRWGRDKHRALT
jgi:hypothetical protein